MEEAIRRTASQRNTTSRRKHKKIRIYNLKAYRKILIQLTVSVLILILIASVRGLDNPFAKNIVLRINSCISNDIDWSGAYKGINTGLLNIIDYSKTFFSNQEKIDTQNKTKQTEKIADNKSTLVEKASEQQKKVVVPIDSKKIMSKEVAPVFSSMNSMDIDIKYIKAKVKLIKPVNGRISSPYGIRINPITHKEELHSGIDIAASTGTSIRSAFSGEVIEAIKGTTFGNFVKIRNGKDIVTIYAHCSKILVKKGQKVLKGQVIAKVGNTGMSLGPHLHFEVLRDNRPIDPTYLLSAVKGGS